jgi:uncharacterized protein (DUF1015 family)
MATVYPFPALRPEPSVVDKVATLPYDVMNREEAAAMAEGNPLSFLRVSRSEIELAGDVDPYSDEVYAHARKNLEKLTAEAPLVTEEVDSYYLYAMTMNGKTQYGIALAASVDDYDNDVILKHEKTRRQKEDDRTNHVIVTEAHTGPVLLTCRPSAELNALMADVAASDSLLDVTPDDGVRHQIWQVPADKTDAVTTIFAGIDKLYIADGHHRAKSASRARDWCREHNGAHTGEETYNRFLTVVYPADQMEILAYNRVVADFNGLDEAGFLRAVSEVCQVIEAAPKEPAAPGAFQLYLGGKWYGLLPRSQAEGQLDVDCLQQSILTPILAIDDPRTSNRVDFIGGIRGTGELERLVDSGKWAAAFSMYPVTVDQLMAVSDAGEIMPPKSTWFEPKLRDGLLVHTFTAPEGV